MSTPGQGVWITTADAVRLTGRKASTIRDWVARGHLTPRTIRGRRLLQASEVLDVERETRKRARAGRRPTRPQ
jgi:ribosomal protein L13